MWRRSSISSTSSALRAARYSALSFGKAGLVRFCKLSSGSERVRLSHTSSKNEASQMDACSSRRLPSPLQNALRPFELAPAARGQTSPATVDEVLNHANGGAQPLRRDILPRHCAGDLRRRSAERTRRWMRRIRLDLSDPAALWTRLGHGMDSCYGVRLRPCLGTGRSGDTRTAPRRRISAPTSDMSLLS